MDSERPLLLEVKNLKTQFFLDEGIVRAVEDATFRIYRGETLGVVGESGCGKSVTARSILRIVPRPGRIVEGQIIYHRPIIKEDGTMATEIIDLTQLDPFGPEIRRIRGAEISMVFQEPMTSLSPVHTIGAQIEEAILLHQNKDREGARNAALEMLHLVGMPEPDRIIDRYPHELSGGMRQRAIIAMALSCQPALLIADEPTTALDVTTEAQILALMRQAQEELGMAIMFITHNLGVIAQMTKYVIVMYLGKVVEEASVDELFYSPKHPYTQALLRSIPRVGTKFMGRLESIKGTVPDPYNVPKGCPYHPRCNRSMPGLCDMIDPPNIEIAPNHKARCWLYRD